MKEEKNIKTLRFNTRAIGILTFLLFSFLIMLIIGDFFQNNMLFNISNLIIIAYFTFLEPIFSISFIYHIKKGRYKDYPKFFISYIGLSAMLAIVIICLIILVI